MTDYSLPQLRPNGLIAAYGQLLRDQVVTLRKPLEVNGQVDGKVESRLGGSAVIVCQSAHEQGLKARILGHCGVYDESQFWLESLNRQGIETIVVRRGRAGSTLAIQLASTESALIHDPGDRFSLTPDDVTDAWFDNVSVLYVSAFNLFYEEARPTLLEVFRRAFALNIPYAIDLGVASMAWEFGRENLVSLFDEFPPAAVFCNESEGEAIGLPQAIPGANLIVQHRGSASTRVFLNDEIVLEMPVTPIATAADFVGAGAAFVGGYLAGWLQGADLDTTVLTAHLASARFIRRINV